MAIKHSSSTTLLVLSAAFAVLGSIIPAPEARLLLFALAGLVACVILFLGPSAVRRFIALVVLAAVILQAFSAWEHYRANMQRYRQHQGVVR